MGDADYLYAFMKIVLPIAYEFAPELVMSAIGVAIYRPNATSRLTFTIYSFCWV